MKVVSLKMTSQNKPTDLQLRMQDGRIFYILAWADIQKALEPKLRLTFQSTFSNLKLE